MSKDVTREIAVYTGKKRPKKDQPLPERVRAPGTPTPERASKEAADFAKLEIVPGNTYNEPHVAHRVQLPVDSYRRHFSQEELDGAEMFYRDAVATMREMITANYDGSTRSTPGPRSGGVGDRHRESYVRFGKILEKLTRGEKRALLALVVGLRSETTGRATSPQDIARERGVSYADQAGLAKVTLGLLKGALDRTYEEYRKYQVDRRASRKLSEIEETNRARALSSVRPQLKGPR